MANNVNPAATAAITKAAAKYGLDPKAMMAVAHAESGLRPDAIGDGGHAFGLFQFNNAGGVITGQPNPERYLNPNFNAMEAARHMATIPGLVGAKGQKAINLMVTKFERPANPGGEVQRASSYYGGISDATLSRASQYSNVIANTSVTPSKESSGGGGSNTSSGGFDPSQALLGYLLSQSTPNKPGNVDPTDQLNSLLGAMMQTKTETPTVPSSTAVTPSGQTPVSGVTAPVTKTVPSKDGGNPNAKFNFTGYGSVSPLKNAQVVGKPYQGTHTDFGNWESDNAVDIKMPAKTPIYAAADGVIGNQIGSLNSGNAHLAGMRVHLQTKGNELYYQHLSSLTVKAGEQVKKGQIIGYSGALNHLHLGVKYGSPLTFT